MVNYPRLPPPEAQSPIPRQLAISAIAILMAVVTAVVALVKADGIEVLPLFLEGGLFVIAGLVAAMLGLVGIAMAISKLPSPAAGAVCVATLIALAFGTIVVSNGWYEPREDIYRLLGPSLGKKKHIDLVMFWAGVWTMSLALGTLLGYGIVLSRGRN